MQKWTASILYGSEMEWGSPEDAFEAFLIRRGINIDGVEGGTHIPTGQRDFTFYFDATAEQAREVATQFPKWKIAEYKENEND